MIHQYLVWVSDFFLLLLLNIRNKQAIFIYIAICPDKNGIERNLGQNNNVKKRKREYDENTQNDTRLELLKLDNK